MVVSKGDYVFFLYANSTFVKVNTAETKQCIVVKKGSLNYWILGNFFLLEDEKICASHEKSRSIIIIF